MTLRYLSLFSGMEAAAVALEPLGWQCAAVAEVDRDACAVLAHRMGATAPRYLPDAKPFDRVRYKGIQFGDRIPNLGDVSQVTETDLRALGRVDVIIGGSPCQDLSVAGKRGGLAGSRSSLFHQQLRIFHAARLICGTRWLWWENVLGAFSSNAGADFGAVVGAMAGTAVELGTEKWGREGVALGSHGLVEWGVLDAQWFGVAQRRRRVFAVLDSGNWSSRPPILLEPESLRGDSAPRREPGQNIAGTLSARTSAGSGLGTDFEIAGGLVAMASGQAGAEIATDGSAPTLTCLHEAPVVAYCSDVAHTLSAEGADASEDGAGRGTPLAVAYAVRTANTGANGQAVAFDCKAAAPTVLQDGTTPTLRAMGGDHANGGGQVAVAFAQNQRGELRETPVAPSLTVGGGKPGEGFSAARIGMAVRRLTPRECERLQGAEDDRTLVPIGGKMMADSPRYKMCGNSFAAPCIRWIGAQITRAHFYGQDAIPVDYG